MVLAIGCDGTPAPTDGGGGDTDGGVGTDSGMMMMTDSAVPPTGDGNDTFADADPIEVGAADPTMARIGTPGDLDYYSFEGTAGTWIIVSTEANPDDDPMMVDTVVTLYDSSMTMIAENDDSVPRFNTDSELITRLPSDGTYYVLVQEFSSWRAGETPEGQADFNYSLSVAELNLTAAAVTVDGEGGDDVASAQAARLPANTAGTADFGIIIGDFEDATDVDVYSFTIAPGRASARALMMPSGAAGYGSTTAIGRMWITNADGSETIARLAVMESDTLNLTSIWPPLPAGDYNLFVEASGAPGSNGFYVLKGFRFAEDNPPEDTATETANDDPATPQALTVEADPDDATIRRGYILAQLGDGDTDHFSFNAMATEEINVYCGSATAGSGVMGLSAAVLDSTGAMTLRMQNETATATIGIENLAVPAMGTYLVRLTKTGQSPEVTGTWVRCAVVLAPPAAP
ncbi:MAG: PPC domain-containing protein [Sandaracinaceae bacterium]|nr:PPC domain-containing protein [Sandaracinaceae bacterium]